MMKPIENGSLKSREAVERFSREIREILNRPLRLMEVCGGHTNAIYRYGLKSLLPAELELVSGPGCPVCVTDRKFLDDCIEISRNPDVIIATYGDLIRVPASGSSLEKERSRGGRIRIVYSVMEALRLAEEHPENKIVFPGIGFETTAPASAWAIAEAKRKGIANFSVLSAHKLMPPALKALVDERLRIDGFIAPGHVSSITGTGIYQFLAEEHHRGVVVSGFEPLDIMQAVWMLVRQILEDRPSVENQYSRVVKREGNRKAQELLNLVFVPADDTWRGLGTIPGSGLQIRPDFSEWDARDLFTVSNKISGEPIGCLCGEILKGVKSPADCSLFATECTPENPVGACMVSMEGACSIVYKYLRRP